jgi:hypothetical protein
METTRLKSAIFSAGKPPTCAMGVMHRPQVLSLTSSPFTISFTYPHFTTRLHFLLHDLSRSCPVHALVLPALLLLLLPYLSTDLPQVSVSLCTI